MENIKFMLRVKLVMYWAKTLTVVNWSTLSRLSALFSGHFSPSGNTRDTAAVTTLWVLSILNCVNNLYKGRFKKLIIKDMEFSNKGWLDG